MGAGETGSKEQRRFSSHISRHLAAVARTADEHVDGHLSLSHTEKGGIAGKRERLGKLQL